MLFKSTSLNNNSGKIINNNRDKSSTELRVEFKGEVINTTRVRIGRVERGGGGGEDEEVVMKVDGEGSKVSDTDSITVAGIVVLVKGTPPSKDKKEEEPTKKKGKKGRRKKEQEEEEEETTAGGYTLHLVTLLAPLNPNTSGPTTFFALNSQTMDTNSITHPSGGRQIPGTNLICVHGCGGVSFSFLTLRVTGFGCSRTYNWGTNYLRVEGKYKFKGRPNHVLDYGHDKRFVVVSAGGSRINVVRTNGRDGRVIGRGKGGTGVIGGYGEYLVAGDERGRCTVYRDLDKEAGGKEVVHWHSSRVTGILGMNERSWCSVGVENVLVEWEVRK